MEWKKLAGRAQLFCGVPWAGSQELNSRPRQTTEELCGCGKHFHFSELLFPLLQLRA